MNCDPHYSVNRPLYFIWVTSRNQIGWPTLSFAVRSNSGLYLLESIHTIVHITVRCRSAKILWCILDYMPPFLKFKYSLRRIVAGMWLDRNLSLNNSMNTLFSYKNTLSGWGRTVIGTVVLIDPYCGGQLACLQFTVYWLNMCMVVVWNYFWSWLTFL